MVFLMETMCPMSWVSPHLKSRLIGASQGLILALTEIKGWLFNYLDNWMALNCIGENMLNNKINKGD
jgi:hypothetical protein